MQRTIIIWISILLAKTLAIHYQCLPYPVASTCIIEYVSYSPGDEIVFPTGYQQYHIRPPRSTTAVESKVTTFDEQLYEAMHRPSSIEMVSVRMKSLVLPPELLLGNFADNMLALVNVSNGRNYQITYLDLKFNNLANIDFVGNLINLEMLHLENNRIESLPGAALKPLTKLKYLYLQRNSFTEIPWTDLPRNLIHLDGYLCDVESVDLGNVSLPQLEYLNLQHNGFSTIDVTALLRATPKLKEAYMYNDLMEEAQKEEIQTKLNAHNISSADPQTYSHCPYFYGYEYVDGKCVKRENPPVSTGKAVALSAVAIGTGLLFVYILVIVFKHMNR